jgi:dihydrofolate reductase
MAYRYIGYAIVSDDGMLADAGNVIPPEMIVPADQAFFMRELDASAALVHGRNSAEQPTSPARRRLIASRRVKGFAPDRTQPNALVWNPKDVPVADALKALGVQGGDIAIIGGTDIFGLFLPRYAAFHLTRARGVRVPGGKPVFPGVPEKTPEALLMAAGLVAGPERMLDATRQVAVTSWSRIA